MVIETSREYFRISNFGRKRHASFYNVLVLHKQTVWLTDTHSYTRPDSWFPVADFRHRTLKRFVAICATLPRQLWRTEVWNSLAISTRTSQQIQIEILVEKREEFLTAGYIVFEQLCPWVEVPMVCWIEAKGSRPQQKQLKAKHYLESLRLSEQISNTLTGFQFQFL